MGRDYSKGACVTCKRRKKKCDETKPICNTCSRLKLECSYEARPARQSRGKQEANTKELSPLSVVQRLRPVRFQDATEEAVVFRIPASVNAFLNTLCNEDKRDLAVTWQLMFQDDLVRNALVSCFSLVMGSTPEHGELNRSSYGNALALLRTRLDNRSLDVSSKIPIMLAVQYFGLMDSTGPDPSGDMMKHWKALAKLIVQIPPLSFETSSASLKNTYLLLVEALAYHTTLALFSDDVCLIRKIWRYARVFETLRDANPRGPNQTESSPLVVGQYDIYELVLEVTYLHRQPRNCIQPVVVDALESQVNDLRSSVEEDFVDESHPEQPVSHQKIYRHMFLLHLDAVSICLLALRDPAEGPIQSIDRLASSMLRYVAEDKPILFCYDALVWPLQILALSLRHTSDFELLTKYAESLKLTMDPGHSSRLEAVLDAAQKLRQSRAQSLREMENDTPRLPLGLSLLRKKGGVLS